MAYSSTVKNLLLASINELAKNPELYAARPGKDFIRNRKMGFKEFILLLLTMEGDCLREELYRNFNRSDKTPTKSAFYHQMAKLKEDALWHLLQLFNKNFEPTLYKDRYQLIACDGSVADIFRDKNDKDTYFEPNGKSPRGFNQIHINALYSIMDKKFLDVLIQPARKRNEYKAFCKMVDRSKKGVPAIYIADRGYASYNNFAHVIKKHQFFVIRCTDAKTEKILGFSLEGVKEADYTVDRFLSRTRAKKKHLHPDREKDYRYICSEVPMDFLTENVPEYKLTLRIVRLEIAPGIYENLITNLVPPEFDMDELRELYHLRWSQETAYRDLKYPLCLKAFHSRKYSYIVQEVFARVIMFNYCSEVSQHVKIDDKNRTLTYQVNFSQAAKICRDDLRDWKNARGINVEGLIADNIEPIRPNRTFRRQARFKLPMSFCYRN